jgi:predicted lipoprotein with Yx(FWY)xxD motif
MRLHTLITPILMACALGLAACAQTGTMANAPASTSNGALVGPNGMTLYTFDKDPADASKSVCNGPCAVNWPPLLAAEGDAPKGEFTLIKRDDGKTQWALRGKPLYYWIKDQKPGDMTGDGVNNVWRTARP